MNIHTIALSAVFVVGAQCLVASVASAQDRGEDLDFEAQVVEGQTGGTGQIVLLQRGRRRLPSLVRDRSAFFQASVDEILGDVTDNRRRRRRRRTRRGRSR